MVLSSIVTELTVKGRKWRLTDRYLSSAPWWANGAIVEWCEYTSENGEKIELPCWYCYNRKTLYNYIYRELTSESKY